RDFPLGRYAQTVPIGQVETALFEQQSGQTGTLGLNLDAAEQQIVVIAPIDGEERYDDVPVATHGWAEDQRLFRKSFTHLLAGLISGTATKGAPPMPTPPHSAPPLLPRRDFLTKAGGGLGMLALSSMLGDADAAPAIDPLAPKRPHFAAKAKS